MEKNKKLGLGSVVSVSVGLVIATSCLVSLGQGAGTVGIPFIGAMIIACLLNMTTVASLSELNGLICNILSCGVEASIFAYAMSQTLHLPIPSIGYTIIMTVIVMVANLFGVDMFAKIQNLVAFLLVGSMVVMGIIGALGLGTGQVVSQPASMSTNFFDIVSTTAVAFWLFIGAEYVIPISKDVKNAKRNVPLGMMIGLVLICLVQAIMV